MANKYIDAEKLKAEIERKRLSNRYIDTDGYEQELFGIIDSLQQEQTEMDFHFFAKEMDSIFALPIDMTENTEENPLNWEYAIARHFYELGLNARKK